MGTMQESNIGGSSMKSKYNNMTKKELLNVLNRLNEDIKGYKEHGETQKLKWARKDKLAVKKLFYECDVCKHAKFEVTIDNRGFEAERLVSICHFHKCPYHDNFVEIANKADNKINNALHKLMLDL